MNSSILDPGLNKPAGPSRHAEWLGLGLGFGLLAGALLLIGVGLVRWAGRQEAFTGTPAAAQRPLETPALDRSPVAAPPASATASKPVPPALAAATPAWAPRPAAARRARSRHGLAQAPKPQLRAPTPSAPADDPAEMAAAAGLTSRAAPETAPGGDRR